MCACMILDGNVNFQDSLRWRLRSKTEKRMVITEKYRCGGLRRGRLCGSMSILMEVAWALARPMTARL